MYYPLSQITTNLHTNGGEFNVKITGNQYTGYYWRTSSGKYYTGKTPQDVPIQELVLISNSTVGPISIDPQSNIDAYYDRDSDSSYNYLNLKKLPLAPLPPIYSLNFPTAQDYQVGEFRRYFCKKTNEIIYLEINLDTYNKLVGQDSTILYQFYQPFNLPWQIAGDKTQVYTTNKNIVELTMKRQKLPQFNLYLKENYTRYYQ